MAAQVHCWRSKDTPSNSGTEYVSPINGQYFSATEHNGTCICTGAGTFSKWSITLPSAPGSGKSFTFTLRKNQVDTAAVITISDAATNGTYVPTITVADGDELTIKCVPSGTPTSTAPSVSWLFIGSTTNQSIYGGGNENGIIGITRFGGLLFRGDIGNYGDSLLDQVEVVACAGTITKYTLKMDSAVPAAGTVTVNIVLNGTVQDGTGGTANTTISFTTGDQKKSATFSLAIAAGDYVNIKIVPGGTASPKPISGVAFTSTTAGESHFGSQIQQAPSNSGTTYSGLSAGSNNAPDATEANVAVVNGLNRFRIGNFYARINTNLLSGGQYALTVQNGGDTNITCTILTGSAPTNISGSDTTHSNTVGASDSIDVKIVPTGTPSSRFFSWGAVQNVIGNAGKGSASVGPGGKIGGGAVSVQYPGGASLLNIGNPGLDVSISS
jgi:hypothetical protein